MKKSGLYAEALKSWLRCGIREPEGLLAGSLWFWLTCLPVVTYGPARLALTYYMGRRFDATRVTWKEAARFGFRPKAWLMGATDFLALLLAGGSVYAFLEMPVPLPIRGLYAAVLAPDLLYFISGVYRYPALAREPDTNLRMLMLRGFLMGVGNLIQTLLFACASLLFFMLCAATGAGLVLLYPAGGALLAGCAYREMIKLYLPEDE